MTQKNSFYDALQNEHPLQIVGVINALSAKIAEQQGFKALYLSGAGVANVRGLPDLGLTSLDDVLHEVQSITRITNLPLLVDIDTGWDSPLNTERAVKLLCNAGAMAAHIEDQANFKRCGHRDGKKIVKTNTMCARLEAACAGKTNSQFMLMARTDALHYEAEEETIKRVKAYEAAGADALFLEAVTDLAQYKRFKSHISIPLLANITEFGKTQLYTVEQLKQNNVDMVLYPLSAFRAMNQAASRVFQAIRQEGTQQSVISLMQTRDELYDVLNYVQYEEKINRYLEQEESSDE
ncbi:MAG: methylisocitrate lyase [Candidatus Berkiella sp.]